MKPLMILGMLGIFSSILSNLLFTDKRVSYEIEAQETRMDKTVPIVGAKIGFMEMHHIFISPMSTRNFTGTDPMGKANLTSGNDSTFVKREAFCIEMGNDRYCAKPSDLSHDVSVVLKSDSQDRFGMHKCSARSFQLAKLTRIEVRCELWPRGPVLSTIKQADYHLGS